MRDLHISNPVPGLLRLTGLGYKDVLPTSKPVQREDKIRSSRQEELASCFLLLERDQTCYTAQVLSPAPARLVVVVSPGQL